MTQPLKPTAPSPTAPRSVAPLAAAGGKRWPVALLALTIAACGGGGGSSDSTTVATPSPSPTPAPAPATAAPSITSQPVDVSVVAPAAVSFTVAVTGTPQPTIQWQKSTGTGAPFADIAGATSTTLNLASTTVADSASQYRAVVTNSVGTTTSEAATLTVTAAVVAPVITSQPTAAVVTAPASATFNVTATGTPTVTYQWQVSTDGGVTFTNISGATSATFNTAATVVANSGQLYRVVVSNGQTTTTSNAVLLTVNAAASSGPGAASSCTAAASYAAGFTYNVVYQSPTSSGTFLTTTSGTVNGSGTFHSQTATEIEELTSITAPSGSTILSSDTKTYTTFNSTSAVLTQYGSSAVLTDSGGQTTVDTYYNPPSTDARFTLSAGGSTTVTTHQTVTRNGTAQTSTDESTTVQFVGVETLTVPAGTYQACKFSETNSNNVTTISWLLLGKGVLLKTTSGNTLSQAQSITVNGVAP